MSTKRYRPGFAHPDAVVSYPDLIAVRTRRSHVAMPFPYSKRFFDILFSLTALSLGGPFFLMVALVTRLTSRGPIVYRQERIGQGGRPFMMYKFRSMYVDAEKGGPMLSSGLSDPRITPWGRFMRRSRLDELPQFYNVLIGNMSVVGPRPERQFYIDQLARLSPLYYSLQAVKPGITSLGQIRYGYASTLPEMVERLGYDLLYLERESFGMDLWILAQTLRVIAQGRGK